MILLFKVYLFIFFFSICENICLGCCCCAGNKDSSNESKSGGFISNSFSEPEIIINENNFKNKNLLNNDLDNNSTHEVENDNNINEKTLSNSKEINNQPKETDNESTEENKNKNIFEENNVKPIINNNIKKSYSNTNVVDNPLKSENTNNNISFMYWNINYLNNYQYNNLNTKNSNTNVNVVNNTNNIGNIFPLVGLNNIGSTCYMNAILQCLLHVNELTLYFIDEYPKDRDYLLKTNNKVKSGGEISRAFYNLLCGVINNNYTNNSFSPTEFKKCLGDYNPQFKKFEANDSKDLILYLLQTMHEELNYYGDKNIRLKYTPNQYNIYDTYNYFMTNYNTNNFSKISLLFYGTYKNTTTCLVCKKELYNFQKFEFISFGMFYYHKKKFNIYDGFKDNSSQNILKGNNKFLCNHCNKLQEAETACKILEPPQKLLINIDYGKNKKYQPSQIEFDEIIDITKFVDFDYQQKIRYRIIGVCTHYGHSGISGHYIAFCRNTQTDTWYEFNDSNVSKCKNEEIYKGSPYLLLYERIFN